MENRRIGIIIKYFNDKLKNQPKLAFLTLVLSNLDTVNYPAKNTSSLQLSFCLVRNALNENTVEWKLR